MAAITARSVLVALMLALLLALTTPAAGSDSAFAAAAVKSRQSSASSSGGSSGGGGSNPSGSGGKTGKSKGKGKGGALTEWASKLRGQMPGKFDDKAAKKIFDRASASAVEGGKKLKPTVDEYKAKGWHYQMKPEVIPAAPDGGASSAPTGHPAGFPYQNAAGAPPGAPGTPGGPPLGATRTKLNKSPKMDVTDPETIQKDQGKYEKTVEWKERMEAARKEKMKTVKDVKAKAKSKATKGQWEHDEKQAEVRQKVDKVQGFDDAIASRIEQESAFNGEKIHPGAYFKRLDINKDGILERGESEEVDQLLADYATADTDKITFEEFKRGVRKALKRHKKENKAMGSQGVAASHLGR